MSYQSYHNYQNRGQGLKVFTWSLLVGLVLWLAVGISGYVVANYHYTRDYLSSWQLADKSSTLEAKQKWISKLVETMETKRKEFANFDALFLQTPDNSFDRNFDALKTLNQRLSEISKMDITSFQYQTAIQQITAQEQGEAHQLLSVFKGCWFLQNHCIYWDWFAFIFLGIFGIFVIIDIGCFLILFISYT